MKVKKIHSLLVCVVLLLSLTGCGANTSNYQAYVKSVITSNYLGVTDEYVRLTGANEEDAESTYLQNVTRLADNLSMYYNLDISADPELAPAMVDLAKQIYSKAKFDVGTPYKDNNINYVDVTIYPINIINQTNSDVAAYVEGFNQALANGDYNDYTKEEYEYEFASGIIGILAGAVEDIDYSTPETVKVRIITTEDTYYIGSEDFVNIDKYIILTKPSENAIPDATLGDASPADATQD
jgi:hypothetical protein